MFCLSWQTRQDCLYIAGVTSHEYAPANLDTSKSLEHLVWGWKKQEFRRDRLLRRGLGCLLRFRKICDRPQAGSNHNAREKTPHHSYPPIDFFIYLLPYLSEGGKVMQIFEIALDYL